VLLLSLLACAWEAPLNDNPLSAPPLLNAIEGTVVFGGVGDLGPTFVTVYAADNPGPPAGTGAPLTFGAVAPDAFTGEGAGVQSAPYQITQLPDGAYLLNSLVDVDHNFSPFSDILSGATCGDWAGTHVTDLVTLASAPVEVQGGEAKDDVTIFVALPFQTQRPAFELDPGASVSLAAAVQPIPPTYRLTATSITTGFSEDVPLDLGAACPPDPLIPDCDAQPWCACDPQATAPCSPALWVYLVDDDDDGEVDPYPADLQAAAGIKNVFPRVYLEYIGEALEDERWVAESYPLASAIAIAELTGGSAADVAPIGVPVPAQGLDATFSPVFRHYHPDGTFGEDANGPFDLIDLRVPGTDPSGIPQGDWRVTVILHTGQTWNVPNDIGVLGLPGPESQGVSLQIGP
jgi:hypothetical protein